MEIKHSSFFFSFYILHTFISVINISSFKCPKMQKCWINAIFAPVSIKIINTLQNLKKNQCFSKRAFINQFQVDLTLYSQTNMRRFINFYKISQNIFSRLGFLYKFPKLIQNAKNCVKIFQISFEILRKFVYPLGTFQKFF